MAGNKNSGLRPILTPEIQSKIIEVLKVGNFRDVAARAADISESTISKWMTRGKREKEGQFWNFRQAVLAAEAEAEKWAVEQVWKNFATDPANARWYLERKHSGKWAGPRHEINLLKGMVTNLTAKVNELSDALIRHTGLASAVDPKREESNPCVVVGREDDGEE